MRFYKTVNVMITVGVLAMGLSWENLAKADESDFVLVDCNNEPGEQLCRLTSALNRKMINCSAEACYEIWSQQMDLIDEIDSYYSNIMPFQYQAAADLAELATATAGKICRQHLRGERSQLARVVLAYHTVLQVLKEIQEKGGVRYPTTCNLTIGD